MFCDDAVVAMATTQVVLDQTSQARLVGNSFVIFSAKNYASPACFGKVMPNNHRVPFFLTLGIETTKHLCCISIRQNCNTLE